MSRSADAEDRDSTTFDLHNDRAEIDRAERDLLAAAERHAYPEASRFALRLAFEEGVINAFRHGHSAKPQEPIRVSWKASPRQVIITIEDRGPGFDPGDVPDPTADENIAKPSGRGLMLMRAYMSRVEFNDRGNRVKMTYERP